MIYIIALTVYIVSSFIGICIGQSRMRKKIAKLRLEQLIHIRNLNSMHKPIDHYLTDEINNLMIETGYLK